MRLFRNRKKLPSDRKPILYQSSNFLKSFSVSFLDYGNVVMTPSAYIIFMYYYSIQTLYDMNECA